MSKDEAATVGAAFIGAQVIVRTYSAGCFYGRLVARCGREAQVDDARRIWQWRGAASLSQLAAEGTSDPNGCKFPAPVPSDVLTEVIEVLLCTPQAIASIEAVPVWSA
jgi:uncharacterized protein DUF6948